MTLKKTDQRYSRFRFDAGSLSLNFVGTVRHRGSQPRDLLTAPDALSRWLQLAGLVTSAVHVSSEDYEAALLLREAIHDTVRSVILDQEPSPNDVDRINRAAKMPVAVPQLNGNADRVLWDTPDPLKACLAVIARDAITLLGDSPRNCLKMCARHSCQMLFMDASPAHRRRWCAMSLCGNRSKVALHRQRKKESTLDQ